MSNFNTTVLMERQGQGGNRPRTTIISPVSHRNALVCSHDHLTLFLTLVSGLEFIRFDLDLVRHHGSRCLWGQRSGQGGLRASFFRSLSGSLLGVTGLEECLVIQVREGIGPEQWDRVAYLSPGSAGSFLSLSQLGEKPHCLEDFSTEVLSLTFRT